MKYILSLIGYVFLVSLELIDDMIKWSHDILLNLGQAIT